MPASDIDIGGNHIGEKYTGPLTTFHEDHHYQYDHYDHDNDYQYDHDQDIDYSMHCNVTSIEMMVMKTVIFPKCRTQLFD